MFLKKYIQDFSGFFKIFQDFLSFIKDLEFHVLSMILMIFSRFFRIFQDFSCFVQDLERYLITFHKKHSSFINVVDEFFKIFQDFFMNFHEFSRFFCDFFLHFIFIHHFTMMKSCISPYYYNFFHITPYLKE